MTHQTEQDPYAPPPRYRMKSGGFVRFAILAALLGAAAWGYAMYASNAPPTVVAETEEQMASADQGYRVSPSAPAAPASQSEPSVNQPPTNLPPPATTTDPAG